MQRGVVTIQPKLVQIIQAHTAEISEHHPHTWEKLQDAANQTTETVQLELSKEEVEMILDHLPPPTRDDPEELKLARIILIGSLSNM